MKFKRTCNHCGESQIFDDDISFLYESTHDKGCKFIDKGYYNKWWKFWIRESMSTERLD